MIFTRADLTGRLEEVGALLAPAVQETEASALRFREAEEARAADSTRLEARHASNIRTLTESFASSEEAAVGERVRLAVGEATRELAQALEQERADRSAAEEQSEEIYVDFSNYYYAFTTF